VSILNELSWIDWTSLVIVAVFLIMGLFRGFLWQASRLASLVLAYITSSLFAADGARIVGDWVSGLDEQAAYYLAYFTIFVAVLIVLSLITLLLDRFVKKLELSFYNHLGGGLLGIGTAAALIIAVLGLVYRVLPQSHMVAVARDSYTGGIARQIVERVGLPPKIQALYQTEGGEETGPKGEENKGK
jgi:membrane protein required for colicin V production